MKQSILLNRQYLTNLINQEILPKYKLSFRIMNSETTNSVYIRFAIIKGVEITLRISDHLDTRKNMKQFIININSKMTNSKRKLLVRTIINSIKYGQRINVYKLLSKGDVNEQ